MKGASNTGFKSICLALMGGLALSLPCLAHGGGGGGGGGGHMSGGGGHFSGSSFHSSGMSFHSSSPSFHSSGMSFHPSSTSFGGNTFRPSTSHMHSEMARESAALEAESARHGGLSSAFGALFGSHAARGLTESPASLERAEPSASEFARNESLHEGASESVKGSLTNQEALKNFETAPKSHHFLFFGKHSNATSPAALEANGNRIARPGMTTFDSAEVPTPLSGHALNESLTTNAGLAAPKAESFQQAKA